MIFRFAKGLVLTAIVAISAGTFSGLTADTPESIAGGMLASLTQAGGWATSHVLPSDKVRVPAVGRLLGRPQTTAQSPKAAAKSDAVIQTDREDYPPDTQVNVTGQGWLPREVVELTFTETATMPPGGYTDGPFIFYATTDAHGAIANGDFYTDEHDLGVTFLLTAKGVISGRTAQTTFTDGLATLSQCANGSPLDTTPCQSDAEWVSGNLGASKATYNEGDSIPYRMAMSGLSTGAAIHTLTIEWDTTKSGKHALDYLTTFNRTTSVATSNPCAGISGCNLTTPAPSTYPIPVDSQLTAAGPLGADVIPVPGNFTLYGGTITSVGVYSGGATFPAGDNSRRITISFTASQANPVLAWGGHIASRPQWGTGNSAVAISGSPYHMRLVDIDGSGGNQDRSLSADAVTFPGSITIIKDASPKDGTDFGFSTTGGLSPSTFVLDNDNDATRSEKQAYPNITNFTTYSVTETPTGGWLLNNFSCTVTSPNGGSQTGSVPTVTINLKEGEDVTCKFTNTAQGGQLIVKKLVVNDNGGTKVATDFTFQVGNDTPTAFLQDTDSLHGKNTLTMAAGTYSITEPAVAGYATSYSNCNNVQVTNGGSATCTITNTAQAASLTIVKRIVNDNGGTKVVGDFGITTTAGALTFGGGVADGTSTLKYTATTLTGLSAGSKTLHENAVTGYAAGAGWSCVGAAGAVTANAQSGSVVLANGESATCTITNTAQAASLTIVKRIVNDSGGTKVVSDFGITTDAGGLTFGAGVADGANTLKYTATTLTGLSAGSKTLHENAVAGYAAGAGWSCTGAAGAVNANAQSGSVVLANGESATCTITNDDQAASLTIVKRIANDSGGSKVVSDFGITTDAGALTFGGGVADGASTLKYTATTLTGLSAGSKTLHENAVAGYAAGTGWSCVGAAGAVNANAQSGSVVLANGESATCTITNDDQAASLTIVKRIVNDNGGTKVVGDFGITTDAGALTFSGGVADGASTLRYTATTLTGLSAGSKTLHENAVAGYAAGAGWSCTGAAGAVNANAQSGSVVLANGESATCTITNDDQAASLTIVKRIVNDNGGTKVVGDFGITTDAGALTFSGGVADGASTLRYAATTLTGLSAGSKTLHENAVTGYAAGAGWSCVGAAGAVNANAQTGSVVLANAESATCTITNDDQAASLTIVKRIVNDNGGTKVVSDFGITTDAGALTFGAGVADGASTLKYTATTLTGLSAGSKTLHESDVAGYSEGSWGCLGAAGAVNPNFDNGSVVLGLGESVMCTITNNDDKASPGISSAMKWILKDSATLSGFVAGAAAPGSLTFTLYTNGTCSGSPVDTQTVNNITSAGPHEVTSTVIFTEANAGVFRWKVHYNGDQNNNTADIACGVENLTISLQ